MDIIKIGEFTALGNYKGLCALELSMENLLNDGNKELLKILDQNPEDEWIKPRPMT